MQPPSLHATSHNQDMRRQEARPPAVTEAGERWLPQLAAAERDLDAALAAARASVELCEQALALLAGLRQQAAPSSVTSAARCVNGLDGTGPVPTLPGEVDGCAGDLPRLVIQPERLTAREAQILGLIAGGRSNRAVAERLFLSPRTVERHIANIYRKIHVHNRAEAANYARAHLLG